MAMDENQMDENRIGQKQDWMKSFGPKWVGRKGVGQKLGARFFCNSLVIINATLIQKPISLEFLEI